MKNVAFHYSSPLAVFPDNICSLVFNSSSFPVSHLTKQIVSQGDDE